MLELILSFLRCCQPAGLSRRRALEGRVDGEAVGGGRVAGRVRVSLTVSLRSDPFSVTETCRFPRVMVWVSLGPMLFAVVPPFR